MKLFIKILAAYITMLLLFIVLIIGTYCIPNAWVEEHIVTSEQTIQQEGLYPRLGNTFFMMDNYTDGLMLNLAASADNDNPVQSSMNNPYYIIADGGGNIADAGELVAQNKFQNLEKNYYGRYWQGYLVLLRPLLILMDYSGIRILNYLLLTLLVISCYSLLKKRISKKVAVLFVISLMLINFPLVPYSMQFSTCFYIALTAMVVLLKSDILTDSFGNTACSFFIIGGVTAYLDFLTTPQLTLGLPLLVCMMMKNDSNKWKKVIQLSIFWALGYGGIWTSKWLAGSILTGRNFYTEALAQIQYRTIGEFGEENLVGIYKYWFLFLFLFLFLLVLLLYWKIGKSKTVFKHYSYLLLISMITPVWYFMIRNHSIEHFWFTWRALLLSLYGYLLFVCHVMDINKINHIYFTKIWKR